MSLHYFFFFFFNDTATTEIYTLSLHDALPICIRAKPNLWEPILEHAAIRNLFLSAITALFSVHALGQSAISGPIPSLFARSEEHTSELQSQSNLVCRLLLEKKKKLTMMQKFH